MSAYADRGTVVFTAAVVVSNASQIIWLAAGARALSAGHFGVVLTAQAMYGLLQIITDNGTSFLGARLAARGSLTDADRAEIVRARMLLAGGCSIVGIGMASIGGADLVRAFVPFALALWLFSLLNVWEPYGRGQLGPFALYLALRSLVVAAVAGGVAMAGAELPLEVAGACELAAVLIVGVACSAWALPGRSPVGPQAWRSIRDIGLPAVLTQYNVAVGTIVLGVSGHASAAAVTGVAFRMLTGVQALNGAVAAGLFPRLARSAEPTASDADAARAATVGGVVLGAVMLIAVAVAAEPIVRILLDEDGELQQAAIILAVGATGVTGLVMHRSFALIASGAESQLRRASLPGAAVVTVVCFVAAAIGGLQGAIVAVGGYLLGLCVTSVLIERSLLRRPRLDGALAICSLIALPAVAAVAAFRTDLRIELAVVVVSCSILISGGRFLHRHRQRVKAARGGTSAGSPPS